MATCLAAAPILGLAALSSGPKPGHVVYAFEPFHVTGPDAMTRTCPVCKYGAEPAVQVWVNHESTATIGKIGQTLQNEINVHGLPNFRAFIVFVEPKSASRKNIVSHLKAISSKYKIPDVALIYVRQGDSSLSEYKINTSRNVHDTVFAYKKMKVTQSYINLQANKAGIADLKSAVASVAG